MSWTNCLPAYGPDHQFLQPVSYERAQQLIDEGKAIPLGKKRIHGLIIPRGSEEFLRAMKYKRGTKFTLNWETDDNPSGVWAFHKRSWAKHVL
jgi:hypothetical protein